MKRSRPQISLLAAALLTLPLTAGITLLALWCQPNRLRDVLGIFLEKPVLFPLNALPVGLVLLAAAFLTRNVFFGAAAANLLVCLLSVANRVKIQVRDEPVFPRDLALLKEVGSAVEHYSISLPWVVLTAALGVTMALILLGILIDTKPAPVRILRGFPGSLLGTAGSLGLLWLLIVTVYASDDLYNSLGASTPYRLSVVFNENGFPYNFCHQFTKYLVDRPAGYSRAQAEAWDRGDAGPGAETGSHGTVTGNPGAGTDCPGVETGSPGTETGSPGTGTETDNSERGKPVHVIMVMNEAFSDVTDDPVFAFTEENDPLKNLHAIQADPHTLSLRLVVPGFAGGTANTEFDVFTGMQTNALGASTTSAMRTVNRNLDSVFRVFRQDGFSTSFFHPGNDWFYNRENVFRWLGAEETVFIDQMESPLYKGYWVSDAYLGTLIQDAFAASVQRGELLFHSTTTIQNHMGYPKSKYGEDYPYQPVPLHIPADASVQSILEVYTEGVRDADALLGDLYAYFSAQSEPVLLAYYGDHLPYLGDNRTVYKALDMDIAREDGERENEFSIYEVPCILWANPAAAELLDWDRAAAALDLPENGKLSAAFLGAVVLELTGRGDASPWFAFLNSLRRLAPVVQRNVWMLSDGSVAVDGVLRTSPEDRAEDKTALLDSIREGIGQWRKWSYYKLEQKTLRDNGG